MGGRRAWEIDEGDTLAGRVRAQVEKELPQIESADERRVAVEQCINMLTNVELLDLISRTEGC
jgi:hypothetical protein